MAVILALILSIGFYAFYVFVVQDQVRYSNPGYISSYNEAYHYTFEPETILAALERGETGLFQPIPNDIEDNVYPPGSFPWHQQDYLKVANAIHNSRLDGWQIAIWYFRRNCADNPIGFDFAELLYFNPEKNQHTEIKIFPLSKSAAWGKDEYFEPPPFFWRKSIDPRKIKITADDAIQIAEAHGGKDARLAFQNKCIITIDLYANTNQWDVEYYRPDLDTFEITVNPYSGEYEIPMPQK